MILFNGDDCGHQMIVSGLDELVVRNVQFFPSMQLHINVNVFMTNKKQATV